jgi:predicted phosphodiesterase
VDVARFRPDVVVTGHTHVPKIEQVGSVLYVNPGSAGPRRFNLPVTVARLTISDGRPAARLIELPVV